MQFNGYLTYCQKKALEEIKEKINNSNNSDYNSKKGIVWPWYDLILFQHSDWELLNREQYNEINTIGLRLQLSSELVRPGIDLIRSRKKNTFLLDKKLVYPSEGRRIPISKILNGTLTYISNHSHLNSDPSSNDLISMINQRLNQFKIDTEKIQQIEKENDVQYTLAGVLMVKYDASIDGGEMDDAWCLYLRDYVEDENGSKWRVISGTKEQDTKISSEQALSDIRGRPFMSKTPSEFSIEYKPVYLFYCNNDRINQLVGEGSILNKMNTTIDISPSPTPTPYYINNGIKMTDSSDIRMSDSSDIRMTDSSDIRMTDSSDMQITEEFESTSTSSSPLTLQQQNNNNDYDNDNDSTSYKEYLETMLDHNDLENEVCKHCGISETIDDINTIFFCDLCDLGVHQLCEDPPIPSYEAQYDPWYCRSCSKIIDSTLPQNNIPKSSNDHNDTDDQSIAKRQRLE
ncbi:unnamed protein product [Cunninghamella blakesleeana]